MTPTPAFKVGELISDPLAMYLSDVFTIGANLAGLPGISVPAGKSAAGLPIGIQLLGPPFAEESLFRAAVSSGKHPGTRGGRRFEAIASNTPPSSASKCTFSFSPRRSSFAAAHRFDPTTQRADVPGVPRSAGRLPVINRHAVELAIKTAWHSTAESPAFTKWDRKQVLLSRSPQGISDQPVRVTHQPGRMAGDRTIRNQA